MWKYTLNCELIKITTPTLFTGCGQLGKAKASLTLPDKSGHVKQIGASVEKKTYLCLPEVMPWPTFPEPQPRNWLFNALKGWGPGPKAGESGPISYAFGGLQGHHTFVSETLLWMGDLNLQGDPKFCGPCLSF